MVEKQQQRALSSDRDAVVAEKIRAACIQAAIEGYQNASISGLCSEGAFESAISAIRMLDISTVAAKDPDGKN